MAQDQSFSRGDRVPAASRGFSRLAITNAVAQQRLEGLAVSPATIADMECAVRGEITPDEVIARTLSRYSRVSQI